MDITPKTILMSIHPKYAELIFAGEKKVEFRKRGLPCAVHNVVVYATKPVGLIIGYFVIGDIVSLSPSLMWQRYAAVGGINKNDFDKYFCGRDTAYCIVIENTQRFEKGLRLDAFSLAAPQSFSYISNDIFKTMCG